MAAQYPDKIKALPLFAGQFDAHKLSAQNCDVLFACYPPGTEIAPHKHDTDNHGVITRGELIITMLGETRRVKTGQWYHVPANVEHAAKFEVETDEIKFWFNDQNS